MDARIPPTDRWPFSPSRPAAVAALAIYLCVVRPTAEANRLAESVERGDFVRAEGAFDAARRLSSDVDVGNALAWLAVVKARTGRGNEAREDLRRADSISSSHDPLPLHNAVYLAQAYLALGDPDRDSMAKTVLSERFLIRRPLLQALQGEPGRAPHRLDRRDAGEQGRQDDHA